MQYFDSGVNKYAIGLPSEDERKKLIADRYILMTKTKEYELWYK